MYINYKFLYEQGLDDTDYHNLQKVFQQEDLFLALHCGEVALDKYEKMGLVQYVKTGSDKFNKVRLSRKGKALMTAIEQKDFNEEMATLLEDIISEYTANNKPTGKKLEIQNRLIWFVANTGFNSSTIRNAVSDYLTDNSEYTLSLENLLWKPPSKAFSVHMNLKDSTLFDVICVKYRLDHNFFNDKLKKDKSMKWLQDISSLTIPKNLESELYLTGSYDKDTEMINKLKYKYLNKIKDKK